MGLDISHGAFSASCGAFDRFRRAVAEAIGGSWPEHHGEEWFWGDGYSEQSHPGLFAFLSHSDCEGEISPQECGRLADELEALLPRLDALGDGAGHIARDGGYGDVCRQFIAGCRLAAERGEPLEFC